MLAVIYLLFNEGYSATKGADTLRNDLAEEAIFRLADLVGQLLPDGGEVHGAPRACVAATRPAPRADRRRR